MSEKGKMRPYKLTEEIQGLITVALSDGCTRTAAFGSAGIARDTFYKWLKDVPEFKQAVEDAEADARTRIETRLTNLALDGDRFAIMYYLQNRYPDDWKDTRNYKIDQNLVLDDKRKSEATDNDIMDMLEDEGVDCSDFRDTKWKEANEPGRESERTEDS